MLFVLYSLKVVYNKTPVVVSYAQTVMPDEGGAIVLAAGRIGFALTGPTESQSYTSVSLVTEIAGGDYVASGYPTNFSGGEARTITLQVENHYPTAGAYTVLVEL